MKITKKLEKDLIYCSVIFIGQTIALSAILNSNIEVGLKIAFIASMYVFGAYLSHTQMKIYRTSEYLALSNGIIHRDFLIKNKIGEYGSGEEAICDIEYLDRKIMENLSGDRFNSSALACIAEYAVNVGVSMAIVKYALPLFMN